MGIFFYSGLNISNLDNRYDIERYLDLSHVYKYTISV